jgi:hypothetical protein
VRRTVQPSDILGPATLKPGSSIITVWVWHP